MFLQQSPEDGGLLQNGAAAGAADGILQLNGTLVVQASLDIFVEARINSLQLFE